MVVKNSVSLKFFLTRLMCGRCGEDTCIAYNCPYDEIRCCHNCGFELIDSAEGQESTRDLHLSTSVIGTIICLDTENSLEIPVFSRSDLPMGLPISVYRKTIP